MAFIKGQVDRFGRPIPASPGYQVLVNSDGSEIQQRNRLILPASLVASDSPDNDASVLVGQSPADIVAALEALGYVLPKSIYNGAIAGASVSAVWVAGLYKRLEISMHCATGSATDPALSFAGMTMAGVCFSSNGYLTNSGSTGAGSGTWTQADQYQANAINLTLGGQAALVSGTVDFGTGSTEVAWNGHTAIGLKTISGGASIGSDGSAASGFTITFGAATTGWLSVIGYK